jgi:carbonic anhydrase
MVTRTKDELKTIKPEQALKMLKDGNLRFLDNQGKDHAYLSQVDATTEGQQPFAVVLGCIDSRVPPEVIFDLGIGDIFSIRIAGNFVNGDILGSMEFAAKVVGSKHFLVLGHTSCGAVQGAYQDVELGNLTGLLEKIKPAVETVRDRSEQGKELDINEIAKENVLLTIKEIKSRSPILKEMVENGEIGLSGGMYDVGTGKVTFFE